MISSIMQEKELFSLETVRELDDYIDRMNQLKIANPYKFPIFSQIDTRQIISLYNSIDNIFLSSTKNHENYEELETYMTEIENELIRRTKMIVFLKRNSIKIEEMNSSLIWYPSDLLNFLSTSLKYLKDSITSSSTVNNKSSWMHFKLLDIHMQYSHKLPNMIDLMSFNEINDSIYYLINLSNILKDSSIQKDDIKIITEKFQIQYFKNLTRKISRVKTLGKMICYFVNWQAMNIMIDWIFILWKEYILIII